MVAGSLGTDDRWPRFGARCAEMGINSALALPMSIGDQVIGSINCYAFDVDAFGQHAIQLGSKFASPAAVSLYNAQMLIGAQEHTKQMQSTLAGRKAIYQAIGVIRARSGVSHEQALDQLRKISRSESVGIAAIAHGIVEQAVQRARDRHDQA